MMNDFQSMASGQGMLKNFYDSKPTKEALARRKKKLEDSNKKKDDKSKGNKDAD